MITAYHAKYFAHDLTRRSLDGLDRLSMSLFDAAVDLKRRRWKNNMPSSRRSRSSNASNGASGKRSSRSRTKSWTNEIL